MFTKDINVKVSDVPSQWSAEAADFINKVLLCHNNHQLLKRKCKERLGKGSILEVKEHTWLRNVQWQEIYKKEFPAPYVPREGDNFDANYCNKQDIIDKQAYDYYLHKINSENYFNKFYMNFYDLKNKELFFELDSVQYKFTNCHDEKEESAYNKQALKSSIGSNFSTGTPRIIGNNNNATNLSMTMNLNQSQISSRRGLVLYK